MDYYTLLGISKDASKVEITQAYRKLAKEHHPDKGGSDEMMKKLSQAYNILRDEVKRSDYNTNFDMDDDENAIFPDRVKIGRDGECLSQIYKEKLRQWIYLKLNYSQLSGELSPDRQKVQSIHKQPFDIMKLAKLLKKDFNPQMDSLRLQGDKLYYRPRDLEKPKINKDITRYPEFTLVYQSSFIYQTPKTAPPRISKGFVVINKIPILPVEILTRPEEISRNFCKLCTQEFGLFNWRHYCQICSGCICSKCFSNRDYLIYGITTNEIVCNSCSTNFNNRLAKGYFHRILMAPDELDQSIYLCLRHASSLDVLNIKDLSDIQMLHFLIGLKRSKHSLSFETVANECVTTLEKSEKYDLLYTYLYLLYTNTKWTYSQTPLTQHITKKITGKHGTSTADYIHYVDNFPKIYSRDDFLEIILGKYYLGKLSRESVEKELIQNKRYDLLLEFNGIFTDNNLILDYYCKSGKNRYFLDVAYHYIDVQTLLLCDNEDFTNVGVQKITDFSLEVQPIINKLSKNVIRLIMRKIGNYLEFYRWGRYEEVLEYLVREKKNDLLLSLAANIPSKVMALKYLYYASKTNLSDALFQMVQLNEKHPQGKCQILLAYLQNYPRNPKLENLFCKLSLQSDQLEHLEFANSLGMSEEIRTRLRTKYTDHINNILLTYNNKKAVESLQLLNPLKREVFGELLNKYQGNTSTSYFMKSRIFEDTSYLDNLICEEYNGDADTINQFIDICGLINRQIPQPNSQLSREILLGKKLKSTPTLNSARRFELAINKALEKNYSLDNILLYFDLIMTSSISDVTLGCFGQLIKHFLNLLKEKLIPGYVKLITELLANINVMARRCCSPLSEIYYQFQCYSLIKELQTRKLITTEIAVIYSEVINRIKFLRKLVPYIPSKQLTAFDGLYYHLVLTELYISYVKDRSGPDYDYLRFDGAVKGWFPSENPEGERGQSLKSITSHSMQIVEQFMQFPIVKIRDGWYSTQLNIGPGYTSLDGFSFNMETGMLQFFLRKPGKGETPLITMDDIKEIFSLNCTSAFLTLDHPDAQYIYHPYQEMKYAPQSLSRSLYLCTLLAADYLLKMITTGVEIQTTYPFAMRDVTGGLLKDVDSKIKEYLTPLRQTGNVAHRFWFEPDILKYYDKCHDSVISYMFDKVKMKVRKHLLKMNEAGEYVDSEYDDEDGAESEFAKRFTQNYDKISRQIPLFARLRELAKINAACAHLRAHYLGLKKMTDADNFPIDTTQIYNMLEKLYDKNKYIMQNNNVDYSSLVTQFRSEYCRTITSTDVYNLLYYNDKSGLQQKIEDSIKRTLRVKYCKILTHMENVGMDSTTNTEINDRTNGECCLIPAVASLNGNYRVYGGVNMNVQTTNGGSGGGPRATYIERYDASTGKLWCQATAVMNGTVHNYASGYKSLNPNSMTQMYWAPRFMTGSEHPGTRPTGTEHTTTHRDGRFNVHNTDGSINRY